MGRHGRKCCDPCKSDKPICVDYKNDCGECGKMKLWGFPKTVGLNKGVPPQPVSTDQGTKLTFSHNSCGFNNLDYGCGCCCNYNGNNNGNNNFCISCAGVYSSTILVILDTIPGPDTTIHLILKINNCVCINYPITGSVLTGNFSTNLNLCKNDVVSYCLYSTGTAYTGMVSSGNVSLVKVNEFIGCH